MTGKKTKFIIGIDEVGRGPIAGPVTVCAFISSSTFKVKNIFPNQIIRDSKKIKKPIRNSINQTIRYLRKLKINKIDWVIASRSAKYIDIHGIVRSIDMCIESCISTLKKRKYDIHKAQILLDGGLYLKNGIYNQETIIKGDEKIGHIAIASILAKVSRDNYMEKLSKKYISYGWDTNMGYGSALHMKSMKKNGITKYHRLTYTKGV